MFMWMAIVATLAYFVVSAIIVILGLLVFEFLTKKYKDMEEIKNGNTAVALSIAGKVIGICIILAFAIYHSFYLYETVVWGIIGIILQMLAYLIVNNFSSKFSVEDQLMNNNKAVGILSLSVSVGLGFVIGASIT